jgi:predicted AAA+ superfamily ATPase
MLLTGLRRVGKTVLLNEIDRLAKADRYRTIVVEAHEDKPLGPLLARIFELSFSIWIESPVPATR